MIQKDYRLDANELLEHMRVWNQFLKRKVHLIACGGTAMTLLNVKPSTRDVDFMTPNTREYDYLTKQLTTLGYAQVTASGWKHEKDLFRFDLFRGNRIHTTELLESPLTEGRHTPVANFSRLYIGILNDYDLIVSKLMRGTNVDFEDCVKLAIAHQEELDLDKLVAHFHEMVGYDVAQDRLRPNIDHFMNLLKKNTDD